MVVANSDRIICDADDAAHCLSLWILGADPLIGEALCRTLEAHETLSVAMICQSVEDLPKYATARPDAVLVVGGRVCRAEQYREIKRAVPGAQLIVVAWEAIADAWGAAIPSEVDCVLSSDIHSDDLPLFIQLTCRGYPLVCKSLLKTLNLQQSVGSVQETNFNALSPRDKQIMACLVEGMSNKEIANRIGGSVGAVKVQLRALLKKVSAENRTKAAVLAVRGGFDPSHHLFGAKEKAAVESQSA